MDRATPSVETILIGAIEIADPAEREAFLNRVCASDPDLRERAGRMVADYHRAGNFLEPRPPDQTVSMCAPAEAVGTVIGPYKLLEQIGTGGMGLVFVAEQTEPVRRRVALKIIKPGMDNREVIARFEAERQALALMDHPNIARVLDCGATDAGRPFFVMELVKGVPITDYCDAQRLPVRGRLELFLQVCQAVQHAHQKGIIHRDLKPSNVLVAAHDAGAVAKVIDFGIAKAVDQSLTDRTLYTGVAQMLGTPLYMSPEQAGQGNLDVDTRTDVYSLGVMLYELLTGTTPINPDTLQRVGFDELRRIIRDDEPVRPSARLSTLNAEAQSTVANRRGVEPNRLRHQVRGELDWVVMRCLEKDRARRYESVSALADDIRRYLADEPVSACPPSVWYRARKFVQRNRTASVGAALTAASLVLGAALVLWESSKVRREASAKEEALIDARKNLVRAERGEKEAQQRAINEEKLRLKAEANWKGALLSTSALIEWGKDLEKRKQFERAADAYLLAVSILKVAVAEMPEDAKYRRSLHDSAYRLADALTLVGDPEQAANAWLNAARIVQGELDRPLKEDDPDDTNNPQLDARSTLALKALQALAEAGGQYQVLGAYAKAEPILREARTLPRKYAKDLEEELPEFVEMFRLDAEVSLGLVLAETGRSAEALAQHDEVIARIRAMKLSPAGVVATNPILVRAMRGRADLLFEQGKAKDAAAAYRELQTTLEALIKKPQFAGFRPHLAWFLTTCPDLSFRDPKRALELTADMSADPQTRTAALYRAGDGAKAASSLSAWSPANGDYKRHHMLGDFLRVLVLARVGNRKAAQRAFEDASNKMRECGVHSFGVRLMREEAAEALGILAPAPRPKSKP